MGFDIAIYNGFCGDAYKIVNSAKAAYLYADEVRIYEYPTEIEFDFDGGRDNSLFDKYSFLREASKNPEILDRTFMKLPDYERKKILTELGKECINRRKLTHVKIQSLSSKIAKYERVESTADLTAFMNKVEQLYGTFRGIDEDELTQLMQSDIWLPSFHYSDEFYQKMIEKLQIQLIMPKAAIANNFDAILQSLVDFDLKYISDNGFKIMNDVFVELKDCPPLQSLLIPAQLSEYTLSMLPGFEEASLDEVIDIRKELNRYIIPYRAAILRMAQTIKEIPNTTSFQRECMTLYLREIEPQVAAINAAIHDNNVFKNIAKKVVTNKETWASVGALVTAFATTGDIANAVSIGAATALAGLSITEGIVSTLEEKKKIKDNEMFFLYEAGQRLKK